MKFTAYDPRDKDQRVDDAKTWKETENTVLIVGLQMMLMFPGWPIAWDEVAKHADYCDEPISAAQYELDRLADDGGPVW